MLWGIFVSMGSLVASALTHSFAAQLAPYLIALRDKSPETQTHSRRVGAHAVRLGFRLQLSEAELREIHVGAVLHDLGKLHVDTAVLHKPGKLDAVEMVEMREHAARGQDYLAGLAFSPVVQAAARSHHERWDGMGYPDGLKGEEIPLVARIVAVVDTYDTIVGGRTYDPPRRIEIAVRELETCAGAQFDPKLAEVFLGIVRSKGGVRRGEALTLR